MSRVCQVTGKRAGLGNNVSHANNKTRRRVLPNLQSRRYWLPSEGRWVTLKLSARGIKIVDKRGIERVVLDLKKRGERV